MQADVAEVAKTLEHLIRFFQSLATSATKMHSIGGILRILPPSKNKRRQDAPDSNMWLNCPRQPANVIAK